MPERSYRAVLWALALTGLCLDQATKYGVFAWLQDVPGNTWTLFQTADRGGFHLTAQSLGEGPHVNKGALWGWKFWPLTALEPYSNELFAGISLLAAVAIAVWGRQKSTAGDRWLCTALGLILAGTLGNFYDRVVFHGVRDFLHWNYLFDWPVFNVADCCLVCGAGLLLLQAFAAQPAKGTDEPGAAPAAAAPSPAQAAAVSCAGPKA